MSRKPPATIDAEEMINAFLRDRMPAFRAPIDAKAWPRQVEKLRRAALERVFLKGYDPRVIHARPRVVWGETLRPDSSYAILKLRYEAYPNYWIPALLYEPARLRGKVPVVLNPNGHHRGGKAADYKQARCANLARRGVLALNIEFIGMSELEADCNHGNQAHLDLTGMAGVGLFYLALKKGLDTLLSHRHADPKRVGVTGLSGGGWQTIVLAALDPRVTLAVPVAGYTAIRARIGCPEDIGDNEQAPPDQLAVLDYDTMTAMLAPRPTLVILNEKDDCCFQTARVKPVIYDAVRPTFDAMNAGENFEIYSNQTPGTHNYDADNRNQLYRFITKHFSLPGDTPCQDLHRADELLGERDLNVGLPAEQETMMSIARRRADTLARKHRTPRTGRERAALRRSLRAVMRFPSYGEPLAATHGHETRLRLGPWTLPVTASSGARNETPVLVINESGRQIPPPMPIVDPGPRYAVDLLGHGELRCGSGPLMLVDATGERLLGIQVAQALAAARWVLRHEKTDQLHLIADGWNMSFVALLAAALEPKWFRSYTTYGTMTTLRNLMDWPMSFHHGRSFFCFGLLEVADVPQIRALMEGVEYRQPGRCVPAER